MGVFKLILVLALVALLLYVQVGDGQKNSKAAARRRAAAAKKRAEAARASSNTTAADDASNKAVIPNKKRRRDKKKDAKSQKKKAKPNLKASSFGVAKASKKQAKEKKKAGGINKPQTKLSTWLGALSKKKRRLSKKKAHHFKRPKLVKFKIKNFYCPGSKQKITLEAFCNNVRNCKNGADEITTLNSTKMENNFAKCENAANSATKQCYVKKDYICNTKVQCRNISPCQLNCSNHFLCPDGTCLPRSTVCDGDTCNDCPTLERWNTGHGFKCPRNGLSCKIPQVMVFDGIKDCDDGSDLCFASKTNGLLGRIGDVRNEPNATFSHKKCFRCLDGSAVVAAGSVCNGVIDCPDMSDECLCQGEILPEVCQAVQTNDYKIKANCSIGEVVCPDGQCIERDWVCDGVADCSEGWDEDNSFCRGTKPCANASRLNEKCRCTRMAAATCNQKEALYCNHVSQCTKQYGSSNRFLDAPEDECTGRCPNLTEHLNLTKKREKKLNCSDVGVLKDLKGFKCPIGNGTFKTINQSLVCNGFLDCRVRGFSDEDKKRCRRWRFYCLTTNGAVSIPKNKVCDGYWDCTGGLDESNKTCHRRHRFQCLASLGRLKHSIAKNQVCDFVINCNDKSDEMNCNTSNRFYCEDGKPLFIRKRLTFNGVQNCKDWSDECPTIRPPGNEAFSSRYELIANAGLRVIVWIMGLLAIIGNLFVIASEIKAIRETRSKSATLRANHLLVINLASADSLMGIYLIMLGAAGVRYSGIYCSHDLMWRSSDQCTAMGILVVLSSEVSVLTMVVMTCVRLFAVYKPFSAAKQPKQWLVVILATLTWAIALVLALVPIDPSVQSTFTKAWIKNSPYFHDAVVKFPNFRIFLDRLLTFTAFRNVTVPQGMLSDVERVRHATSWQQFNQILKEPGQNQSIDMPRLFGYYSTNSVCIPQLFVTTENRAWKFSFAITVVNFIAFLFVSLAYVIIYHKSVGKLKKNAGAKSKKGRGFKQTQEIQRKIIRLIITDFCCWVPISVMAFINFGGVPVPPVAYAFSAIILLPINSALNPIVYSELIDVTWNFITCKKKKADSSTSYVSTSTKNTSGSTKKSSKL